MCERVAFSVQSAIMKKNGKQQPVANRRQRDGETPHVGYDSLSRADWLKSARRRRALVALRNTCRLAQRNAARSSSSHARLPPRLHAANAATSALQCALATETRLEITSEACSCEQVAKAC